MVELEDLDPRIRNRVDLVKARRYTTARAAVVLDNWKSWWAIVKIMPAITSGAEEMKRAEAAAVARGGHG
jgi:hypothetical protein